MTNACLEIGAEGVKLVEIRNISLNLIVIQSLFKFLGLQTLATELDLEQRRLEVQKSGPVMGS